MNDIGKNFVQHYQRTSPSHLYPDEWVRKTFLGQYPNLIKHQNNPQGSNLLDLGCGDGRNILLFNDMEYNCYGTEVNEELCEIPKRLLMKYSCFPEIRVGCNSSIPFEDKFFDCVFAGASFYYLMNEATFEENISELRRVLKNGGWFVASFPTPEMQIHGKNLWDSAEKLLAGIYIMRNDPLELRNGFRFRYFQSKDELKNEFSRDFFDISVGEFDADFYGNRLSYWMLSCFLKIGSTKNGIV